MYTCVRACGLILGVTNVPSTRACLPYTYREAQSKSKADNEGKEGGEPELADAALPLQSVPDGNGEQDGMCPTVPPQMVENSPCISTLPDDKSGSRIQHQSPCSASSDRGVDPQLRSGSCRLS